MSRRDDDTVTLCCPLTDVEQDIAAEMARMTGLESDANLVRVGLWHLARHLRVPIGSEVFALRKPRGAAKTRRLKARQLSLDDIAS